MANQLRRQTPKKSDPGGLFSLVSLESAFWECVFAEGFHVFASGKSLPFLCQQFWCKREGAWSARGEKRGCWRAGGWTLLRPRAPSACLRGCITDAPGARALCKRSMTPTPGGQSRPPGRFPAGRGQFTGCCPWSLRGDTTQRGWFCLTR